MLNFDQKRSKSSFGHHVESKYNGEAARMSSFKFKILLDVLCDWRIVKICYMHCFQVLSLGLRGIIGRIWWDYHGFSIIRKECMNQFLCGNSFKGKARNLRSMLENLVEE